MTDYLRASAFSDLASTKIPREITAFVDNDNFYVARHRQPILTISRNNGDIDYVRLYPGCDADGIGAIDAVTREVQNGLLDALSYEKIIPPEVRVCYDHSDTGRCYVVCKEERVVLDTDYCTMVCIKSHPSKFEFGPISYVRWQDREQ